MVGVDYYELVCFAVYFNTFVKFGLFGCCFVVLTWFVGLLFSFCWCVVLFCVLFTLCFDCYVLFKFAGVTFLVT